MQSNSAQQINGTHASNTSGTDAKPLGANAMINLAKIASSQTPQTPGSSTVIRPKLQNIQPAQQLRPIQVIIVNTHSMTDLLYVCLLYQKIVPSHAPFGRFLGCYNITSTGNKPFSWDCFDAQRKRPISYSVSADCSQSWYTTRRKHQTKSSTHPQSRDSNTKNCSNHISHYERFSIQTKSER